MHLSETDKLTLKNSLDLYIMIYEFPEDHWKKGMHVLYAYLETINMSKRIPLPMKEKKIAELKFQIENYIHYDTEKQVSLTKYGASRMIEILCTQLNIPVPREKPNTSSDGQGFGVVENDIVH